MVHVTFGNPTDMFVKKKTKKRECTVSIMCFRVVARTKLNEKLYLSVAGANDVVLFLVYLVTGC